MKKGGAALNTGAAVSPRRLAPRQSPVAPGAAPPCLCSLPLVATLLGVAPLRRRGRHCVTLGASPSGLVRRRGRLTNPLGRSSFLSVAAAPPVIAVCGRRSCRRSVFVLVPRRACVPCLCPVLRLLCAPRPRRFAPRRHGGGRSGGWRFPPSRC